MVKIIDPVLFSQKAVQAYRECFKDEIKSIVLFGSASGNEDFNPQHSDINLCLLVDKMDFASVNRVVPLQKQLRKDRFAIPLIFDKNYVLSSLDSFPIEFLSMKLKSTLLWGEDFLTPLTISKYNIRLQIERELKGKSLHLYEGWMGCLGKLSTIKELARISLLDFAPIFTAVLFLMGDDIPNSRFNLFDAIDKKFGLAGLPFSSLFDGLKRGDQKGIREIFPKYIQAITFLSNYIDNHTIEVSNEK